MSVHADHQAVAIFGFSYYTEHRDKLEAFSLNGVSPDDIEEISNLHYPLARLLCLYINHKSFHHNEKLGKFVKAMLSDEFSGSDGILVKNGLIPLQPSMLNSYRLSLEYAPSLTSAMLAERR